MMRSAFKSQENFRKSVYIQDRVRHFKMKKLKSHRNVNVRDENKTPQIPFNDYQPCLILKAYERQKEEKRAPLIKIETHSQGVSPLVSACNNH